MLTPLSYSNTLYWQRSFSFLWPRCSREYSGFWHGIIPAAQCFMKQFPFSICQIVWCWMWLPIFPMCVFLKHLMSLYNSTLHLFCKWVMMHSLKHSSNGDCAQVTGPKWTVQCTLRYYFTVVKKLWTLITQSSQCHAAYRQPWSPEDVWARVNFTNLVEENQEPLWYIFII